jgi:hypothetical protein
MVKNYCLVGSGVVQQDARFQSAYMTNINANVLHFVGLSPFPSSNGNHQTTMKRQEAFIAL